MFSSYSLIDQQPRNLVLSLFERTMLGLHDMRKMCDVITLLNITITILRLIRAAEYIVSMCACAIE